MSSTDSPRRIFYCADCGNRSRCLPLAILALNMRNGGHQLSFVLELCPPCKLAWIDRHWNRWSPGRRGVHQSKLRSPRLSPQDVDELLEVQQWR